MPRKGNVEQGLRAADVTVDATYTTPSSIATQWNLTQQLRTGIGMALHEETHVEPPYGHFVNHNLGEYHVPVNADIGDIDAFFVEENDAYVNPLLSKGVGEIGIVGVAAAVANAVYHATGKRIRELPITPDKLL